MSNDAGLHRWTASAVLVTGGAGFIGSNLVRWILLNAPDTAVVNLDLLTYAGHLRTLQDVLHRNGAKGDGRHFFVRGDIRDRELVDALLRGGFIESDSGRRTPKIDAVIHLAAETHVDRSILGPGEFVSTNVLGTQVLLEATRRELEREPRDFRFLNVSTDEVYGSLASDDAAFTELSPLRPNSPYSASKAGADCLVRAYVETYGLPCMTTRCSNNYGPYQFPEKLIPLMISRALVHESLPVYGDGLNVRDWLHVEDHCSAVWDVCRAGRIGHVYNIGGGAERTNIDVVRTLLRLLDRPESLIRYVTDRPGHDRRYAIDASKITRELAWRPGRSFESGLAETVTWYLQHESWWRKLLDEAHGTARSLYLRNR